MDPLLVVLVDRVWEDCCLLKDIYEVYKEFDDGYRPPIQLCFVALAEMLQRDNRTYLSPAGDRPSFPDNLPTWPGLLDDLKGDEQDDRLIDFVRVVFASVIGDLFVYPFWAVNVSAVSQKARVDGIYPFTSYTRAFQGIWRSEGIWGLWKGAKPMCVVGLFYNFHRIRRALYLEPGNNIEQKEEQPKAIKASASARKQKDKAKQSVELAVGKPRQKLQRKPSKKRIIYQNAYERGPLLQRAAWALALHPLELAALRMVTEAGPEHATVRSAWAAARAAPPGGWRGLFVGCRSGLLNAVAPYGGWALLGVPFLVKCRRMVRGCDRDVFQVARAALRAGPWGPGGLLSGLGAAWRGLLPALAGRAAARALAHAALGVSAVRRERRARRKAFYAGLLLQIIPAKHREALYRKKEKQAQQKRRGADATKKENRKEEDDEDSHLKQPQEQQDGHAVV